MRLLVLNWDMIRFVVIILIIPFLLGVEEVLYILEEGAIPISFPPHYRIIYTYIYQKNQMAIILY
ncbi:hypothetical protein CW282_03690 [Escherichia coli]|nr:hypothetical protein CW282_03690 [Escherichia coli]